MVNYFYLPDPDSNNSITQKDIDSNALRITKKAATMFPSYDTDATIIVGSASWTVPYSIDKQGRSNHLKIGRSVFEALKFKAGNRLKITRKEMTTYILEKVS